MVALERSILALAQEARTQKEYRERALGLLADHVPFHAAFFHALSPRVPLETGVWQGFDLDVVRASARHWDQYAVDLARLRDRAMEQGGVAVDVDVLPAAERARLHYCKHFTRPLGISALMLVHLTMSGRIVSVIGLALKRRARAAGASFAPEHAALLREVAPALAVADVAHATHLEDRGVPIARLRCEDGRLTPRQRDLVEHVALGHTNEEIALALGISPNTARNQLAVVFRKLDASNRAEVVRLAVLR